METTKHTVNTDATNDKNEKATSSSPSYLSKILCYFKVKQLSELEVFLFGKIHSISSFSTNLISSCFLGFAMILGNRSTGWNSGINTYGFDVLCFNLLFSASGFICLCLCMAEMSSALPFSGGIFGFVRASVGPFFGFMVACTEFMFSMVSISLRTQRFLSDTSGQTMVIVTILFCLVVNLIGGKPVFALTSFLGFCIVIMMLIYLFGTLSAVGTDAVSFSYYSPLPVEFTCQCDVRKTSSE